MKLHLPSGLRAALFACFAAFAGLSTTLSTATVAGGVFAVTMAGQAMADGMTIDTQTVDADTSDPDIDVGDITISTSGDTITVAAGIDATANKVDGAEVDWVKAGAGSLTLTGAPTAARPNSVVIKEGTLVIGYRADWGGGFVGTTVTIEAGSTLKLNYDDALGQDKYGTRGCSDVILNGAADKVTTMEVLKTTRLHEKLSLNGYATVKGEGGFVIREGLTQIAATGSNNIISTNITLTDNLSVDVAGATDALEISGRFTDGSDAALTKTGGGTLTLSGGDATTASTLGGTLNVGAGTVKNTGVLTLGNLTVSDGAGVSNEGTLNLTGTLTLSSALQMGAGATLTIAEGAVIDLSNMTAEGNTYTLLSGEGDLDLSKLSGIKITGVTVDGGIQWTYGTDGKLSYTTIAAMTYAGGDLVWDTTTASFTQDGSQIAFSDGGYVVFESGTSNVTLGANISAAGMEIADGATLSIAELGGYTLAVENVTLDGTMKVGSNDVIAGLQAMDGKGTLVLNWSGVAEDANLAATGYTGKVQIEKGAALRVSSGKTYDHVTVTNGGQFVIVDSTYAGDVTITGSGDFSGEVGALKICGNRIVSGQVNVTSEGAGITVWDGETGTITGALVMDGKMTKTGDGTLALAGNITGGKGIEVTGGVLNIGGDAYKTISLVTGDITMGNGTTLWVQHNAGSVTDADGNKADLTLNGATLYSQNVDNGALQWGTLTSKGESKIEHYYEGQQQFDKVTGEGSLNINSLVTTWGARNHGTILNSIENFNGSITETLVPMSDTEATTSPHKLTIGVVHQDANYAVTVSGPVYSSGFAKTGEGSVTLDSLAINDNGKLTVNYQGGLSIGAGAASGTYAEGALTLGNNISLVYTSTTDPVLNLVSGLFEGKAEGSLTLDVSALEQSALSGGLNTGIAADVAENLFTLNLGTALTNANVHFEKDETNNVWKLVCDAPADTSIWHWNTPGDAGVWADDNANGWAAGEGDSPSGRNVVFGADGLGDGSETTVRIAGEVKAASILVETAVGQTYTFTGDGDDTTANDGITAGSLTKTGEGSLVISTDNSSTGDLTIEAGTVTFSGGDWDGAIAVNGSATLDVSSVADDAIGAITAAEGATVMVGSGVTVASLTGGMLETAVATRDVTITSATNLVSVSNGGTGTLIIGSDLTTGKLANAGTVSLLGDSTITELSNTGTVTTGGKNITIATVTNGGTLDAGAGSVTLGSDGTFTSLKAGSVTTAGNTITVDGESSLGTVSSSTDTASSLVVKAGTTTIGSSTLQELSVSSKATVSAALASLTVLGDITTAADGTGTATTNSAGVAAMNDITVGGSATIAGRLVSDAGAVSVGKDASTSAELSADTTVTIGGTATITGGLSAGGKVTLGKGGTIGDITAKTGVLKVGGTLSLGGALKVGGAVSGVTRIEVTDAAALAGTMVSAGGLTMGDTLTFAFSSGTLSPVAAGAADKPYTLFTLTDTNTAIDTLLGTDLSKLALEVAGENVETIDSLSVKIDTTTYTLGVDATSNSIVLLAKNTGLVWNVPSDGTGSTLSQDSSDEFGGGESTSLEKDADLIFNGGGATGTDEKAGTVYVDGSVKVGSITIEAADTTYTFSGEEGDSLTTETLNIKDGDVANAMTLTVTGAVAAADAIIENTGTFSVGEGSEIGGITGEGDVIVTGSALIGSIDGATSLTTQNSGTTPTTVTLTDITGPIALDIAANTTVTVSPAASFALYAASSDLFLTSLTSGGTLNVPDKNVILEQKTTDGGTLTALSLNLEKATGSSFTGITTDALTLDASALSTTTALLSTGSLASLSGNAITLTLTGITDAVADGLAYADYLLISGLDAKVGIAELSDDLRQLFALSDKESYALYDWVENAGKWDLVLSVKQDDPRYWTGGDLSDGSSDDKWAGSLGDDDKPQHVLDLSKVDRYEALDTVDNVRLDTNTTIDLTAATLDTTANPDGLIIRQLEGTADLTLKGDAADLATLDNTAGATTLDGDLTVQGMKVVAQGGNVLTVGDLTVEKAGSLTVAGTGSIIAANATAKGGSITVEQGGKLDVDSMTLTGTNASVTNNGTVDADSLKLDSSSATFNAAAGTTNVGALNGTAGKIDGTINVIGTGGSYAGNYGSNAAIVLGSTAGAAEQNLTIGGTSGSENLAVTASKDAELTLTYTDGGATLKSLSADGATVVLDNAGTNTLTVTDTANSTLKNGNLGFNISATDVANGNALEVTKGLNLDGTTVWVAQAGSVSSATFDVTKGTEGWTLFTLTDGTAENVTVKLDETDPFFRRYFEAGSVRVENGVVKADLITDYYTRDLAQTENGTEAMEMLDAAALAVNPQTGDLADVLKSLDSFKNPATRDAAAADTLAAAVAGSGIASLGMALSGDVERQLKAIRNRTTTMGVDPNVVNEDMPYFNAWINAEGDYRSMDDGGTLAGYTVNSYGGTVGFDMDVTPELTWGLALTAMYGDFESDTVDVVDGDMDTYYVSAFARAMSGAWTHTFVATLGISRSELSRTVSHNSGSYTAEGDADGISFGVLYEVARTYALNEDATACWQPVFNVAYRHIEVDGYEESGSDAALRVGDQSLDTVTFGLGARLQAVAGENIYNRTSIFEARALVKFDAGDRESEVENALLAAPSTTAKVKSAEMDAVGLEVGVGLTVPVGFDAGSIFVDGSLEFRGSYTNFNAAAGYRVNF